MTTTRAPQGTDKLQEARRRRSKQARTQRSAANVENFLEGLGSLVHKLQQSQQKFELEQANKHREWLERRDQEKAEFQQKLQQDSDRHHQSMIESMQQHQQILQQQNMSFMAVLFKRMDRP